MEEERKQKEKIEQNLLNQKLKNESDLRILDIQSKIAKSKSLNVHKNTKIKFVKDRPGHDFRYALNNNKILKKLKWKVRVPLRIGLAQTFDWYINNKAFFKGVSKKLYMKRLGLKT